MRGSSLHQRVLFLFVAEVAITHADYSVLPTSPSYPSATITVKEPACARDLAATSATTGKNPCGEGILQCPVEQTVSPVSIGVVATDASRSVITPVPPVNYFFEGDADGEQSVKIATDPGLGVVTLYYTPPLGAINGTSARAVLHLRRGVPDAPTSGVVCTLTVIWTVLSRVDNAVASVQGGVVRPAPAPAASRAQAPTGPALRTSTAPAGVPSI